MASVSIWIVTVRGVPVTVVDGEGQTVGQVSRDRVIEALYGSQD